MSVYPFARDAAIPHPKKDFHVKMIRTSGASPEEAPLMAEEALQLHIDSMVENGEEIPEPRPLAEAYARAREEDAIVVVTVPARLPGYARAKRINVTLDEELLADIDHLAAKCSMSRSALLGFFNSGPLYIGGCGTTVGLLRPRSAAP